MILKIMRNEEGVCICVNINQMFLLSILGEINQLLTSSRPIFDKKRSKSFLCPIIHSFIRRHVFSSDFGSGTVLSVKKTNKS